MDMKTKNLSRNICYAVTRVGRFCRLNSDLIDCVLQKTTIILGIEASYKYENKLLSFDPQYPIRYKIALERIKKSNSKEMF